MNILALQARHADEKEEDGEVGSIFPILRIYFVLKEVKHFILGNPGGCTYMTGEGR